MTARSLSRLSAATFAIGGLFFALYPALRPYTDETTLDGAAAMSSGAWVAAHVLAMAAFTLLTAGAATLALLTAKLWRASAIGAHADGASAHGTPSADVMRAVVVPADVVPADVVPADVVPADVVPAVPTPSAASWLAAPAGARPAVAATVLTWLGTSLVLPYYGAETFGLQVIGARAVADGDATLLELAPDFRYGALSMTLFAAGLLALTAAGILLAVARWSSGTLARTGGLLLGLGLALYLPQFFGPPSVRIAHGLLLAVGGAVTAVALLRTGRTGRTGRPGTQRRDRLVVAP